MIDSQRALLTEMNIFRNKLKPLEEGEVGRDFFLGERNEVKFELKYKKILFKNKMCLILILRDVELLEKLNKAKVEEKYKKIIITTISHEFRTPMTSILSGVNLAYDETSNEGKEYLDCAKESAESLLFFFEDIVDYTKLSDSTFVLNESIFPIRRAITSIRQLHNCKLREKSVHTQLQIQSNIPE